MTTYYVDIEAGNDANSGLDFANRKKTLQGITLAELAAGDTVRIMGSPAATSLGQTATFTNKSRTLTFSTAVTTNISVCDTAWTAAANVTATTSTTRKEGTASSSLAIAAGFTTGKVAHFATGTLDLSTYQQISFWIRVNLAVASGVLKLRLSTDTTGDTATHEFTINRALNVNQWTVLTFDNAVNMNAAIASVALVAISDPGTVTVLLDNILACKAASSADSVTLQSLVGKNTAGETWWPIKSINGTTVIIDQDVNSGTTTGRGYAGTTETVTIFKRETLKTASVAASTTSVQSLNDSGASGNTIKIEGGWNRTDMSTQTLESIFDGLDGFGRGVHIDKSFIEWNKVGFVRYDTGININNTGGTDGKFTDIVMCNGNTANGVFLGNSVTQEFVNISGCSSNGNNGIGTQTGFNNLTLKAIIADSNAVSGIVLSGNNNNRSKWDGAIKCRNNGSQGFDISASHVFMTPTATGVLSDNATSGLNLGSNVARSMVFYGLTCNSNVQGINSASDWLGSHRFYNYSSSSNSTRSVTFAGANTNGEIFFFKSTFNEATKFSSLVAGGNGRVYSYEESGTDGNHIIRTDGSTIQSETGANRHTLSGIAWKLSVTSTTRDSMYPLILPIAQILGKANKAVTFKAFIMRDNIGLTTTVRIRGGSVSGVANDVTASGAAAANTYEEVTLSFTPTEDAVFEAFFECYGGTTFNAYIDDLTITAAA